MVLGTEETDETCPHCSGSGRIRVDPEVKTVEAYYFGCWGETGHYWRDKFQRDWGIEKKVGPKLHPRIDGGFCPGSIPGEAYKRSCPERDGEAALHHIEGWTVLAWWDRSVDERASSNSNVVARGTHTYPTMLHIAKAQFPSVIERQKVEIKLVETKKEGA